MNKLKNILESISERIGRLFAWSVALLVLVICVDVFMRYVLDISFIWLVELEIYLFALSFLFASGYAFKHDNHVRVDLFYAKWGDKGKAWTNLLGGLFFLLPWCLVSIMACWKYAMTSFRMGESSAQPGGLPGLYMLKFCLLLGFIFLLIQGIASMLQAVLVLRGKAEEK